jgi:hypothetical protein
MVTSLEKSSDAQGISFRGFKIQSTRIQPMPKRFVKPYRRV